MMVFAGLVIALAGLAIAAIGLLGWVGRLSRNRWNGIRTRATMASDVAWDAAHRIGGPFLIAGGVAWLGAGAALVLGAQPVAWLVFALGFALVVLGGVRGNGVAREVLSK